MSPYFLAFFIMAGIDGEGWSDADVIVLDEIDLGDAESAALALEVDGEIEVETVEVPLEALGTPSFIDELRETEPVKDEPDSHLFDNYQDDVDALAKKLLGRADRLITLLETAVVGPNSMEKQVQDSIEAAKDGADPEAISDLQKRLRDAMPQAWLRHACSLVTKLLDKDNPKHKIYMEKFAQKAIESAREHNADPAKLEMLEERVKDVMPEVYLKYASELVEKLENGDVGVATMMEQHALEAIEDATCKEADQEKITKLHERVDIVMANLVLQK